MIRTIVFDLGKVLLDFDNRLITEGLARYSRATPEEIHRMIFLSSLGKRFDKGEISPEDFFDIMKERLFLRMTYEEFVPLWSNIFTEVPGMKGLVERLSGKYPLALLSNTNKLHFDYITRRFPFIREFDHHFLSYQLHESKPDPDVFRTVIEKADVSARDIYYTDDIAEYVDSARHLGMRAFKFESAAQTARHLSEGGVWL